MEEQGRSLFSVEDFLGGGLDAFTALLLAHELAHQWFGDAVSPAEWKDIWLNESFASYGEWMWLDEAGYRSLDDSALGALAGRQDSAYATADPDIPGLFGFEVYEGGATILHALRKTVGDVTFFKILRTWATDNYGTSQSTEDFIELSSKLAGEDLTDFFDTWLYSVNLPAKYPT
jgi:aminopeptidase N